MLAKVKFDYHDLWIGIRWFINRDLLYHPFLQIHICVIPMLPIRIIIALPRS